MSGSISLVGSMGLFNGQSNVGMLPLPEMSESDIADGSSGVSLTEGPGPFFANGLGFDHVPGPDTAKGFMKFNLFSSSSMSKDDIYYEVL
jgi:hypothetical protein